ncbi:MAG: gamma-glutamylcyclotransferase family protein [Chloroherpetonaceae bacterium]|nr:gamma-glutamylcyclotransferase family protein [Chloroherpetonaceae bacterium]
MQTASHNYLFVYGTLRTGGRGAHLVSKYGHKKADAKVKGLLYDIGDFPAFIHHEDAIVYGELIQLRPNVTLEEIDEYEGVDKMHPHDGLYRRDKITAVLMNNETVEAWIYVWNQSVKGLKMIENGDYLAYLKLKSAHRLIR